MQNRARIRNLALCGAVALAVALGLALGATARPWGGAGGGPGRLFEKLDFSAETRARLEAVMERSREDARPLRESVAAEREALEAILGEGPIDGGAALAQVERVGEARTALDKHRVATSIELQALMTDEERAAWNEAKQLRKERRQRMHERFRGRFGPVGPFGPFGQQGRGGGPFGLEHEGGFEDFAGADPTPLP